MEKKQEDLPALEEDLPEFDPFTLKCFLEAHKRSAAEWLDWLPLLRPLANLVVEYGTGPVDRDILERVLFYDHFQEVKYGRGIEWDYLKQLLGPDYSWPFLYGRYQDWYRNYLFGAESYWDLPIGFCARPMCMVDRYCICGPMEQLPLTHVYRACHVHRLEAAIVASEYQTRNKNNAS